MAPLPPMLRDETPKAIRLLMLTGYPISRRRGLFCEAMDLKAWYRSLPTVASPRCTVRVSHPRAKKTKRSSVLPMEESLPRSWPEGSSLEDMAFAIVCKALEASSSAGGPGSVYAPAW